MRIATRYSQLAFWQLFVSVACCSIPHDGMMKAQSAFSDEKADRPNILWITSEDNAAHWLGCYGNTKAETPRLDALAADSTLFTRAYSNAPVCAVARSGLLHGTYAVTMGTQHMRSRHPIPDSFKPHVSYLRELGYYCTNNSKTDYNRKGDDREIWDACHGKAHYKNRAAGQPFFAIFNLTTSHESALFPKNVVEKRERGIIPQRPRLDPDRIEVPPYLPDLPEVRQDIAIYHDCLTVLDTQIGNILDELADRGLAHDTIIFYYGDHGGITPRGKRYLTDTGIRIPMIVHVPEKWQHLSPFQPGQRSDEIVAFVDLTPTLLSICGLEKPAQMQGRAFLGTHRVEPSDSPIALLFADRFDEICGMRRGLTDGRYKYIRRFTSHLPAAPCSMYSLQVPSWAAWKLAWEEDRLPAAHRAIWETPQPVEELYDLANDPWEVHNLASDPAHADRLAAYCDRLHQELLAVHDTGVIPESMFAELAGDSTICEFVQSEQFELEHILQVALTTTEANPVNLPAIARMLADDNPIVRYWAALGAAILGEAAAETQPRLVEMLDDPSATVRITAATALCQMGARDAGAAALAAEFERSPDGDTATLLFNAVTFVDCKEVVPQSWVDESLNSKSTNQYVRRFAHRLHQQRKP